MMQELVISPFSEFAFMRHALVAYVCLAISASPLGVLLMLRRLSLAGDAIAHATLPGVAIAYLISGLSLVAMTIGGLISGLIIVSASSLIANYTDQFEDVSMAAFYLFALALGVLLISLRGNSVDLLQILFGSILAIDRTTLLMLAFVASLTLITLAIIYRALILESYDPDYLRLVSRYQAFIHVIFMALVVFNLVAGFQAMGTLMMLGMMILPAASIRFWAQEIQSMLGGSIVIGLCAGIVGLLLSYHLDLPSGTATVFVLGFAYFLSALLAPHGILTRQFFLNHRKHLRS